MVPGSDEPSLERAVGASAPPPRVDDLLALPKRAWKDVVAHARRVLKDLPDEQVTPAIRRLRTAPANRLLAGRPRRDLAAVFAEGGVAWIGLHARLREADVDPALAFLVDPEADVPRLVEVEEPRADQAAQDRLRDEVERLRERLRTTRAERDDALRRADGATARLRAAEEAAAAAADEAEELRGRVAELEAAVEGAGEERRRAVEREQRRQDATIAGLREELAALRRADDERRRARQERERVAEVEADRARQRELAEREAERVRRAGGAEYAAPGRPSELPPGAEPGTTAHARALLAPGRRVLVDGYNVAKTIRPDLGDEAAERRWLEAGAAQLTAQRQLDLELFWDGDKARGSSMRVGPVQVHFSPKGVTADDDIEFAVAAAPDDEPIVVVTDDRGLRQRLAPYRVDLLGTQAFSWVLRG